MVASLGLGHEADWGPSDSERWDWSPGVDSRFSSAESVRGDFYIVCGIANEILDELSGVTDPREIVKVLNQGVNKVAGSGLSYGVEAFIERRAESVRGRLKDVVESRTAVDASDLEAVAYAVISDLKSVGMVDLQDEDVERVMMMSVPLSKIPGIFEMVPEVGRAPKGVAFKGGIARLALKLAARANAMSSDSIDELNALIDAELPLADIDLVVSKQDISPREAAERMGVGILDIEVVENFDPSSLKRVLASRDTTYNQAIIVDGKLYCDFNSFSSLMSSPGYVESAVPSTPGRLFARESFTVKGRKYEAANTLYRLVKMVAEGKAGHFVLPRYNFQAISLGNYWLTMVRKWAGRPDRVAVFCKAFACAKAMGQTATESPGAFLCQVLARNPRFDMQSHSTPLAIAKWMAGKYVKSFSKTVRKEFALRSPESEVLFSYDDETPVTVSGDHQDFSKADLEELEAIFASIDERDLVPEVVEA